MSIIYTALIYLSIVLLIAIQIRKRNRDVDIRYLIYNFIFNPFRRSLYVYETITFLIILKVFYKYILIFIIIVGIGIYVSFNTQVNVLSGIIFIILLCMITFIFLWIYQNIKIIVEFANNYIRQVGNKTNLLLIYNIIYLSVFYCIIRLITNDANIFLVSSIDVLMFFTLICSHIGLYFDLYKLLNIQNSICETKSTVIYSKVRFLFIWFIIIILSLWCQTFLLIQLHADITPSTPMLENLQFDGLDRVFDILYYVIVTFTTTGYGDIRPNTIIGKVNSLIVITSGLLYIVIYIGALFASKPNKECETGQRDNYTRTSQKK